MKKLILFLGLISFTNLSAYTYTFRNTTNKPVWVDPYWHRMSFPEEQMFGGTEPQTQFKSNVLSWQNANQIKGPVRLLPHKTYSFEFPTWRNEGLCVTNFRLGLKRKNIRKAIAKVANKLEYKRVKRCADSFEKKCMRCAKKKNNYQPVRTTPSCGKNTEKKIKKLRQGTGAFPCGSMHVSIATDSDGTLVAVVAQN